MAKEKTVMIDRSDLLAAWAILENLAVSLDQIGGTYGIDHKGTYGIDHKGRNGAEQERAFQAALAGYLKPELVRAIGEARIRLGRYVSDAEADVIVEEIPYWDHRTTRARNKKRT